MRIRRLRTARGAGWERLTYAWAASLAATRGDYDIVHFHSFASSAFCALPKLRGKKVVTTAHRIEWQDAKWSGFSRWFLRYCEWAALHFSDALTAVSQALKDDLATRHRVASRTIVIGNGVTRPDPASTDLLAPLGLSPDGYLLVVGRLVPEKGVDVAIDAYLALLRRRELDVDLVIVGGARRAGNDTERELRARAEPAGARVHFTGVQEPNVVAMLYDHALALVAPSYQEGQPLVVSEAMASGSTIVASDIAAHVELLGDAAVWFPVGSATGLADSLERALEDPDASRELGIRARARISGADNSWDAAARATEAVLASL
jgi:glycosyltransferase involved in cell wall biosynthesis